MIKFALITYHTCTITGGQRCNFNSNLDLTHNYSTRFADFELNFELHLLCTELNGTQVEMKVLN